MPPIEVNASMAKAKWKKAGFERKCRTLDLWLKLNTSAHTAQLLAASAIHLRLGKQCRRALLYFMQNAVLFYTVFTKRKYTLVSKPITQNPGGLEEKKVVRHSHRWGGPNWTKPPGVCDPPSTFHLPPIKPMSTRLDKSVYFLLGETVITTYLIGFHLGWRARCITTGSTSLNLREIL